MQFVRDLLNAPINKIALENPVSVISSKIRKADQMIQPWQFGDSFSKRTCLWLKNLPKLTPTNIVNPGKIQVFKSGNRMPEWYNKARHDVKKRSKTFPGIAKAMAEQWGTTNKEEGSFKSS